MKFNRDGTLNSSLGMETVAEKPKVNKQGTAVVERDGDWFLVMFPNGNVESFKTKEAVEKRLKSWFWIHNDPNAIGVGLIEWRI